MSKFDVKEDRWRYIGGSDIAIIMNLSPFKDRYTLLLEKAQLKEIEEVENKYVEYGNVMEPKIRDYINTIYKKNFVEYKQENGDLRVHLDGYDEDTEIGVLEIKTTSQIHEKIDDYKVYLVQLLFYMVETDKQKGLLAVYERPSDFNEDFDEKRLNIYGVDKNDYKDLINSIYIAIELFRNDLKLIKENPLLSEEDLLPDDVNNLSKSVVVFEEQLKYYKELEAKYKKAKEKLKNAMEENGITKWVMANGTKITLVEDKPDEEIEVETYDEDLFIQENQELHERYHLKLAEYKTLKKEIKKGKKGYVLITPPKK